ncbi:hypothetical protein JCGZ_00126 [Jatropha curcas]|uniref:Uncharacterized protein n=1 Tax=Jatropha curcas TaxID=180498 RepID=A0A067JW84_JATCU|nr:hypothetical protein JCGZ_00126 [Jatropha curcas]
MGLASEEDVQVLFDQFKEEDTEVVESRTSGAKPWKENIRIIDVPLNIDEGELLDISSMYGVAPKYKLIRPFEYMRDGSQKCEGFQDVENSRGNEKKKAEENNSDKGAPLVILDLPTVDTSAAMEFAHVEHAP